MTAKEERFYLSEGEIDDIAQDSFVVLDEVNEEGDTKDVELNDSDVELVEKAVVVDLTGDADKFSLHNDNQAHPYMHIIESFEFQEGQLKPSEVVPRKSLTETPLHVVDSRVCLIKLLQTLRSAQVIGVDLITERKFEAVHVLSVSTEQADYIIDLFTLKNEALLLNEIFINPKIVKVFAKSHSQLSNLQRSLCLYVINMFDVEKAGEMLFGTEQPFEEMFQRGESKPSELHIRPFPEKTKTSCRTTSHFLIHYYHDYKNQLIAKDLEKYKLFLNECREQCKVIHYIQELADFAVLEERFQVRHKAEIDFLSKVFEWRKNLALKLGVNPNEIVSKKRLLSFAAYLPLKMDDILLWQNNPHITQSAQEILDMASDVRKKLSMAHVDEDGKVVSASYKFNTIPKTSTNQIAKKRKFEELQNKRKFAKTKINHFKTFRGLTVGPKKKN